MSYQEEKSQETTPKEPRTKTKLVTIGHLSKTLHNDRVPEHRLETYKALQETIFCEPSLETMNDFFTAWADKKETEPEDYDAEYDKYIQLCLDFELCEPGRQVRKYLGKKELTESTKFLIRYQEN